MSSPASELNIILRAGAGAGKTTRLTHEFLEYAKSFKESQGRFPRIVVTTFTRKATQELKERLLAKALEEKREDLFHFVSSKSQVQISTIHGVLSLFLSRYGAAVGLTPDYKIMNEAEIRKGARKIIRKYLLEDAQLQELLEEYDFGTLENSLIHYFNESVVFPEMRFISGAELEKETEKFIKKTAGEIRKVALEIQQESTNDKWQEYAQSLAQFSWRQESESWEDFYARLESFWEHLAKPVFRKTSAPFSLSLNDELSQARDHVDELLESGRYRPAFWEKHQKNCELFEKLAKSFAHDFMASKLEQGLLSMSDLEVLSYKIIREAPEAAVKFSQEWDYWMVDEYQDTSPVQVALLRHLIGEKRFFVVGDPQQSIYLFRGARSEVFQQKVDEVRNEGGQVESKLVNYRSSPEVLEFLNLYFTSLGKNQFAAMTPAPDKEKKGNAQPIAQIQMTETSDDDETSMEVLSTVARIQELLKDGVPPEQICVLGRTHKTLEDIAKVAQDHGVPLQLHSGSSFYERREVLDALAILKFLINPHDNANFVALLRSPWFGIADSELLKFCHHSKHSYWKEALKSVESLSDSHPIRSLKGLLGMSEEKGLSWTLKSALVDFGLFDYSAKVDSTGRREANLWKVLSLLSSEERRPGFNFLDFLDASLETLTADKGGEDADATPVIEPKRVNFMTVHASKGLQFDQVILPGMGQDPRASHASVFSVRENDGLWSLKVRNDETQAMDGSILADQITEELRQREAEEFNRVLYVALTRAKLGITLLWDRKVGKKSWAAHCPLNLEEGLHEEKDFSYLVRVENTRPEKMLQETLANKDVRKPWTHTIPEAVKRSVSVTSLVAPESAHDSVYVPKASQMGVGLAKAQQGTQAHRLFESLKYSSYEDLLGIIEPEFKKPLDYLKNASEIPLFEIIEKGFVEWGFAMKQGSTLLQGQIDLWGVINSTLWVVDYKTGSQKYSDVAFQQLKAYAWSLRKMGYADGIQDVKLAVVYPLDEVIKIKTLSDLPAIEAEMEKLLQESLV
ncbi:exonuclease RexA [Bdellovibrio bacteriovorus]|uniref:DNA 3'-5' helicase n=1 Tax=Bdellovibrio bacteriovorus TaxID=959 RepID=A0A150WNM4_BDEBC|nr:UvrD-helicase domain-containing protein [Bdellovibrio bacteriovorus]KYG66020.1 exonuclease RexA [Bdellovibrio bacteriovorus]